MKALMKRYSILLVPPPPPPPRLFGSRSGSSKKASAKTTTYTNTGLSVGQVSGLNTQATKLALNKSSVMVHGRF